MEHIFPSLRSIIIGFLLKQVKSSIKSYPVHLIWINRKKKYVTSDMNLNSSVCCKLGQTFLTYYMIMKNNIEVTLFACSYLPFVCSNPHLSLFKITYWMTKRSLFSTFFLTKIVANATQSKELLGTYRAIRLYWSKTGNIVSFIKLIFKKNC